MKTSIRAEEKDRSINEEEALRCSDEIIKALQAMSKNDIGALIVLSNENVPAQILESGTRLNSDISAELIEGIFIPKAPLHDGAMIVSGTKIVAAGCFLPISEAENIPKDLGTRHRAAIGITEMIDVTVLIVSEETGIISVVSAGKMKRYCGYRDAEKHAEALLLAGYGQDIRRKTDEKEREKPVFPKLFSITSG